jgi:hypothetical protein
MKHQASWVEDPDNDTPEVVAFKCAECAWTANVGRELYESGRAFPVISQHI